MMKNCVKDAAICGEDKKWSFGFHRWGIGGILKRVEGS
jgi:hypothetical protein